MHFWPFWIYTSLFGKNCQKKFRMAIFGHSKFVPVFLGKIVGKKIGTAIFAHSELIPVFLEKIIRIKSEQPFLAIPNLYQSFWEKLLEKIQNGHLWPFWIYSDNFSVHITLTECNGLESNKICTFLDFYSKI